MRITQNLLFDSIRFYLGRNSRSLLDAQEKVATQKRINRISDNPIDAPRLLDVKRAKAQIGQFTRNVERADSLSDLYDATLGQAEDLISRVKELLLTEANEVTSTPQTREAARLEIASITSQLVQLGNTQFDGRFIFSGFAIDTPAFTDASVAVTAGASNTGQAIVESAVVNEPNQVAFDNFRIQFTDANTYDVIDTTTGASLVTGAAYASGQPILFKGIEIRIADGGGPPAAGDVFNIAITPPGDYQGDSGVQKIEVQSGTLVQQNLIGNQVFKDAAGGVDIFAILNDINSALATDDRPQISALLDNLDASREQLSSQRAAIGSRQTLFKTLLERHGEAALGLELIRSDIEDIDLIEAMTKLTQQQTAFEASLGAASQIVNVSLLDFLR